MDAAFMENVLLSLKERKFPTVNDKSIVVIRILVGF